jgi:hypothetical protein
MYDGRLSAEAHCANQRIESPGLSGTGLPMLAVDIPGTGPAHSRRRPRRDRGQAQGQQAPVVFFSMATSTDEDVSRGMASCSAATRLNVAISRAQALNVIVRSPRPLTARCSNVEDMRLVTMLRLAAEEAEIQGAAQAGGSPAVPTT